MKLKGLFLTLGLAISAGAVIAATNGVVALESENTVETKAADENTWYYRGSVKGVDHWNDYAYSFTYNSSTYVHSLTIELAAGDEFKIAKGGSWDVYTHDGSSISGANWIWFSGGSGQNAYVKLSGTYTFEIWNGGPLKGISATGVDYTSVSVNLASSAWNWNVDDDHKFANNTSTSGTFNWSGAISSSDTFKIVINGNQWVGGGVIDDNLNGTFGGSGDDNMSCNMTGHYALSFNPNTCKLSFNTDSNYYYLAVGETHYPLTYESYKNQFEIVEVSLNYGDEVYLYINGVAKGYSDLQNDEQEGECVHMFNEGTNNAIAIKSSSKYEFYYKNYRATPADVIWAQIDSKIEAGTWAKNFLDNTFCTVDGNGNVTGVPTFETGWSWALLASSYNDLTNGAKNYIYAAGEGMDDDEQKAYVIEAVQRYDYIILNHGSETFYRFIVDSNDALRNVSNSFKFSPIVNTIENNVSIIVVVFVGLVAISATALFIAKRKEQ